MPAHFLENKIIIILFANNEGLKNSMMEKPTKRVKGGPIPRGYKNSMKKQSKYSSVTSH